MSRSSVAAKFAKEVAIREVCQDAVYNLAKKIAAEYESKGNEHSEALVYTSGYIQSFLAGVISNLPKAKREEVIATLNQRASTR